jgi:hypothetical protein
MKRKTTLVGQKFRMESQVSKNSFVFDLFEDMQRNNLNYIYRGLFTQSITDNILLLTEACMHNVGEDSKIKKRIFTILVEGLQNVTRHQEIDGEDAASNPNQAGIFIIQNQNGKYYITTGNPILKANIPTLTKQLEKINSLDPESLKLFYKEVLNNDKISNKGGAGLGLIEMARKSGNKLDFDFSDINSNYSYFYMGTKVLADDETGNVQQESNSMETIKSIHKTINDQNIVLVYNGLHSQDSLLHILSILEEHLSSKDLNFRKRMVYCIIELLQNVVKHGYKAEDNSTKGIFFVMHNGVSYQLNTVNYIKNSNIAKAQEAINFINSVSEKELNDFYDKNLTSDESDTRKKCGLGLAEMRLRTHQKINCTFSPVDDKISAIFVQITI